MTAVGFERHDHKACIATTMARVDALCVERGLQFTPVRRRVLEMLLDRHRAMGAYDILDALRAEGMGSQPPVAYRALDFLVRNDFAHRIERLNAFIACTHPGEMHTPAFLICRGCDAVAETETRPALGSLGRTARDAGFRIEGAVIEAQGLCPHCIEEEAS